MLVPGFDFVRHLSTAMLLRSDLRSWLLPLLEAWQDNWAEYETRALTAGRGGTRLVRAAGHEVVVRPYRRGGLVARLLHDTYIGRQPRPFRELKTLDALRRRGAPVIEVYGAAVHWLLPGCYRGWLATRYRAGSRTLWEWFADAPPSPLRARVLTEVGYAARRLHDLGGWHPDLNLNNILVATGAASDAIEVTFIDFDMTGSAQHLPRTPHADLARFERSARKLDPAGMRLTAADLDAVRVAYAAGAPCA